MNYMILVPMLKFHQLVVQWVELLLLNSKLFVHVLPDSFASGCDGGATRDANISILSQGGKVKMKERFHCYQKLH